MIMQAPMQTRIYVLRPAGLFLRPLSMPSIAPSVMDTKIRISTEHRVNVRTSSNPSMRKKLGEKLKEAREKANLSQQEVADKLNVSRQTISKYELNINEPDLETLKELSCIYEVDINYLLEKEAEFWWYIENDKEPPLILPEI